MKYIQFHDTKDMKGREILIQIVKFAGKGGITLEDIRPRLRLLDVLDGDTGKTGITLEDADAALLAKLVTGFPFGIADRDIVKLCDNVINAKEPPAVMLRKKMNGKAQDAEPLAVEV